MKEDIIQSRISSPWLSHWAIHTRLLFSECHYQGGRVIAFVENQMAVCYRIASRTILRIYQYFQKLYI